MPKIEERLPRLLVSAACIVIIAWGIKAASHILLIILISLFLAYVMVPFPRWLIKRHKVSKHVALGMTVALIAFLYLFFSSLLFGVGIHMMVRLPSYEEHFTALYQQVTTYLNSHGTHFASLPAAGFLSADRVAEIAIKVLPGAIGLLSDRLLSWLLCLLFLVEIVELEGSKRSPLAAVLIHYGDDVQRYIGIQAKTGAITMLANFTLLFALGVDFPIVWCFLYFFLQFIPSLGFIIALVPPTLLALLVLGWKRALLVAGGLLLTQLLSDYLLQPMFMKKGLHVSLFEVMMSLVIWGSLLGPWGGILAVPLTLALRKFIRESSKEGVPIQAV
jgi:AI-2 transport protein TqsA